MACLEFNSTVVIFAKAEFRKVYKLNFTRVFFYTNSICVHSYGLWICLVSCSQIILRFAWFHISRRHICYAVLTGFKRSVNAVNVNRAGPRTLIRGCIFIYLGSAYSHPPPPPINVLAPTLNVKLQGRGGVIGLKSPRVTHLSPLRFNIDRHMLLSSSYLIQLQHKIFYSI